MVLYCTPIALYTIYLQNVWILLLKCITYIIVFYTSFLFLISLLRILLIASDHKNGWNKIKKIKNEDWERKIDTEENCQILI